MKISDLKANPRNPRKISDTERLALAASLEQFGDLGSVVFNEQTGRLVGGHQRSKALAGATIKIVNKYDPPTKTGTVADGYALVGDEKFSYRVVRWDEAREMAALLAANKIQGQWDNDLLRLAITDTPGLNLDVTGFKIPELRAMGIEFKMPTIDAVISASRDVKGAPDALIIPEPVANALGIATDDLEEETDEQYLKENPGPDSALAKENISMASAYDEVQETTKSSLAKIIAVIEFESAEGRDALKKKLRTDEFNLTQYGAKLY